MYKYDTTLFNQVLEALDTGKTIYFKMIDTYHTITNFTYIQNNGDCLFFTLNNGDTYEICPSSGYTSSQLYVPTNIKPYEVVEVEIS